MATSATFINSESKKLANAKAVVPLISQDKSTGEIFFIGTAFYIAANGILITARHNLFNKENKTFENLGVYHFLPDNQYLLRPITKVVYSNNSDIACCLPQQIVKNKTDIVASDALVLTNEFPEEGDQLGLYGYPDSRITKVDQTTVAHFNSEFYLGNRREFHQNGFGLLNNPCYQTTIKIKSGASGGPVFDKFGYVFAVASTGYDFADGDEGENVSFVTPILPYLVTMNLEDDEGNKFSVPELIEKGVIACKV